MAYRLPPRPAGAYRQALIGALRGRPYRRPVPRKPPLMAEEPPWGAPGPAGYFSPTDEAPTRWIHDPATWNRLNAPPARGPLMPEEGIVGPGSAGHFGPPSIPPGFIEALAQLLAARQAPRRKLGYPGEEF
jgi:hypothetical protein